MQNYYHASEKYIFDDIENFHSEMRHNEPFQQRMLARCCGGRRDGALSARALHDAKGSLGSGGALRERTARIEGIDLKVW